MQFNDIKMLVKETPQNIANYSAILKKAVSWETWLYYLQCVHTLF